MTEYPSVDGDRKEVITSKKLVKSPLRNKITRNKTNENYGEIRLSFR